jgi:Arc/MetJ-type ribon-helix-helix transcriptional regulator
MKSDKKKMQFDFSKDAVSRLDTLVETTESSSRAEVIRKSLKLYEYVNEMVDDGYSIEVSKGKERTKIKLF